MLPGATTCSWLLETQSFFLTHGLFQSLTHRATGHRAIVVPGAQMWLMQGRLKVGLEEGVLVQALHRMLQFPGQEPTRTRRRKSLALGRIIQITCLDPVFENTQMLVYKSESSPGAISVPSLIQTVLSVNTGDQGFTVSLLSRSP